MKKFTLIELMIVIAIILTIFSLVVSAWNDKVVEEKEIKIKTSDYFYDKTFAEIPLEKMIYKNIIFEIPYENYKDWIKNNNLEIVAITSVGKGRYGSTSSFIIVCKSE